jgi:hypothetical protein
MRKIVLIIFILGFSFCAKDIYAASRYWVGGTANWDGTAGTKWALTSGGHARAAGFTVPYHVLAEMRKL